MTKSELFKQIMGEYAKQSLKSEDEEVKGNANELLEGLLDCFPEFISQNGVFLACYIISNSDAKGRKKLVKDLLEDSSKSNND